MASDLKLPSEFYRCGIAAGIAGDTPDPYPQAEMDTADERWRRLMRVFPVWEMHLDARKKHGPDGQTKALLDEFCRIYDALTPDDLAFACAVAATKGV